MSIPYNSSYWSYTSRRSSYVGEILPSRRELVRDWLAAQFSTISTDNGYRTTPTVHKHLVYPQQATPSCTICVILEREDTHGLDDRWLTWDTKLKFTVLGYAQGELTFSGTEPQYSAEVAGELLADDMKRCLWAIAQSEVNDSTNPRLINLSPDGPGLVIIGPTYFPQNYCECRLEFEVLLPAQSGEM